MKRLLLSLLLLCSVYTAVPVKGIGTLEVNEGNDYTIKFPGDLSSTICGDDLSKGLETYSNGCNLLSVNIDTTYFEASGDECFKQLLTYRVLNWCEYDGESIKPTVIPRDVDEDDDLKECTLVEAAYETNIREQYPVCGFSNASDIPNSAFIVKVFDADMDGNKKHDLPVKILFRADCFDEDDNFLRYTGPIILRLTSVPGEGYYPDRPCYELYCPTESAYDGYAAAVAQACSDQTYSKQCWTPGFYEYTQQVKVNDNEAPVVRVMSDAVYCAFGDPTADGLFPCGGEVSINFSVDDACTPEEVEVRDVRLLKDRDPLQRFSVASGLFTVTEIEPAANTFRISAPSLPVGRHAFVLNAIDHCGNIAGERIEFEIIDCKSPAPICINGLNVVLMPVDEDGDGQADSGMNTVWATDFIASPLEDCSGAVTYSINYFGQPPDRSQASLTVSCEDPLFETLPVEIHAWDEAGNSDFCETYFIIADSQNLCGDSGDGSIAGLITTDELAAVANVDMQLSGQATMNYQTDDNGDYSFNGLIEGYDYSVKPSLDTHPSNGVSTFDLVLISKHILGARPLGTPYGIIAADANRSGSVTTLDLIQIRKVILGVETNFENNNSWRFIPAEYEFRNPGNPFEEDFPEVININDLQGALDNADFIAVKVGDVNANARPNALSRSTPRSVAGALELQTAEVALKPGEVYTVDFTTPALAGIQGYQFTLDYDRSIVELIDIQEGLASGDNFGIFADQGMITTSWHSSDFRLPPSDFRLFSLVLRAKSKAPLSEALSIGSRLTHAEAYSTTDELLEVALAFNPGPGLKPNPGAGFQLYQNQPNPFRNTTRIGFTLPEAEHGTLSIHDVSGRTLRVLEGDFARGYNEVPLNWENMPVGVLYYTLKTERHTTTKKMLVTGR